MKFALGALFFSHGVSFVGNYLIKGEYQKAKPKEQMGDPYVRIVVMHIAILAGGFFTVAIGSPVVLLLVLVALKTILEVKLYQRERRKKQKPAWTVA
jgi:hypothetical protein